VIRRLARTVGLHRKFEGAVFYIADDARTNRTVLSIMERLDREFALADDVEERPLTHGEELDQRRSELKNGLTDMQRLFLLGKLEGLNDKNAALAAGYSLTVSENTKQRIWKPKVRQAFERLKTSGLKP